MSNKFFLTGLSSFFVLLNSSFLPAQTDSLVLFTDDFESYTAGAQVACQDTIHINVNWNTWNGNPCDLVEDPYITNSNSNSGANSVWIQQNNDLVKPIPNYTTGKYSISFYLYIPSDYTASWGQLAAFYTPDSTEWAFGVKFDPLGNGYVSGGGSGTPFPFTYDTWMHNELIVDLTNDSAKYYFEGSLIHVWQWTFGMWGDTCKRQLSVTDIMGSDWPLPDPSQWYLDDFILQRLDTIVSVKDFSVPTKYVLEQNYPNPFNPTTKIKYQIPELSIVTIKIYDMLGREVASLVNQEKTIGSYEIEFSAKSGSTSGGDTYSLTSGVYFYRLKAGNFIETRKMVLLK